MYVDRKALRNSNFGGVSELASVLFLFCYFRKLWCSYRGHNKKLPVQKGGGNFTLQKRFIIVNLKDSQTELVSVEQEVGEGRAVVRVKDGFVRGAVLELDIWKYVDSLGIIWYRGSGM